MGSLHGEGPLFEQPLPGCVGQISMKVGSSPSGAAAASAAGRRFQARFWGISSMKPVAVTAATSRTEPSSTRTRAAVALTAAGSIEAISSCAWAMSWRARWARRVMSTGAVARGSVLFFMVLLYLSCGSVARRGGNFFSR